MVICGKRTLNRKGNQEGQTDRHRKTSLEKKVFFSALASKQNMGFNQPKVGMVCFSPMRFGT